MLILAFALAQAAAPAGTAPSSAPERKICRSADDTSSRIRRKPDCRTKAQWDEIDRQNEAALGQPTTRTRRFSY